MVIATRLFVGNLPENTKENELHAAFSTYGEITTLDLKSKSTTPEETKKFAFVTLIASNYDVEACIKHFSNENFNGNRLYVTRARESFLERLQRERDQAQKKDEKKPDHDVHSKNPVLKLGDKLNPGKRKLDTDDLNKQSRQKHIANTSNNHSLPKSQLNSKAYQENNNVVIENDKKQLDSDKKRMDSMKKKRLEFKQKQMIIKTGLNGIDKVPNKKVIFSDSDEDTHQVNKHKKTVQFGGRDKNNILFDEDESGDELNFEIKKQFEGKKGQKILDLQSKYKSDKRFTLDEKFMNDEQSEDENKEIADIDEAIELEQTDEKAKQLNILQNVLGVSIRSRAPEQDKKNKPKIGMLRFDPSQPEHAKFLAPVEVIKQDLSKKAMKKLKEMKQKVPIPDVEKVEASKEQFYKVSDTLKEAIAQPSTFSLRSLFGNNEGLVNGFQEQETNYIPLEKPKSPKMKNPFQPDEKNPFTYDSSDSETDDTKTVPKTDPSLVGTEKKAVWKENLFFTKCDPRFIEALDYFNKINETQGQKERRELKSLMKKRLYNKERKNQMFQKKIGGRKKSLRKDYRKKVK